jgi:hypothetical protein
MPRGPEYCETSCESSLFHVELSIGCVMRDCRAGIPAVSGPACRMAGDWRGRSGYGQPPRVGDDARAIGAPGVPRGTVHRVDADCRAGAAHGHRPHGARAGISRRLGTGQPNGPMTAGAGRGYCAGSTVWRGDDASSIGSTCVPRGTLLARRRDPAAEGFGGTGCPGDDRPLTCAGHAPMAARSLSLCGAAHPRPRVEAATESEAMGRRRAGAAPRTPYSFGGPPMAAHTFHVERSSQICGPRRHRTYFPGPAAQSARRSCDAPAGEAA